MTTPLAEKVQAVLNQLSANAQAEVLDFAEFLAQKQQTTINTDRVSEEEHARIVAVLDAVATLSQESGPAVSNRDHDAYLYGER